MDLRAGDALLVFTSDQTADELGRYFKHTNDC